MEKNNKIWILFDSRYRTDEDRAICYEVCKTLKEAKDNADNYETGTVIVEAETFGNEIRNLKIIN